MQEIKKRVKGQRRRKRRNEALWEKRLKAAVKQLEQKQELEELIHEATRKTHNSSLGSIFVFVQLVLRIVVIKHLMISLLDQPFWHLTQAHQLFCWLDHPLLNEGILPKKNTTD